MSKACSLGKGRWVWCLHCERASWSGAWLGGERCPTPGCDGDLADLVSWDELQAHGWGLPDEPVPGRRYVWGQVPRRGRVLRLWRRRYVRSGGGLGGVA